MQLNWNSFRAKFDGKEQETFELLCYHLFCREFNKDLGIFRFKNQTGIETEPIEHQGKIIGFQAKYYETKLSDNKGDITDSITKAKSKNPSLTKILLYTNQELSESGKRGKKKSNYQTEIENHAQSLGVEIEWRVRSHFEAQLSEDKNKSLALYFFSFDRGPIDLIDELTRHTEAILTPIRSQIEFKGTVIKLDRSKHMQGLEVALAKSPVVIVSGEAGVGKTAIIKDFYSAVGAATPMLVFKASEFNISNINQLFTQYGSFTLSDFVTALASYDDKYIVIDSAEKLSDIENLGAFIEFLTTVIPDKWKILLTTRYSYLDALKFQFVEVHRTAFNTFLIQPISDQELIRLSTVYKFDIPKQRRLYDLLHIPFYLDEYLRTYGTLGPNKTASEFKTLLWENIIIKSSFQKNNIHRKREECFLAIAQRRAIEGRFFVSADRCDSGARQALTADDIIGYDKGAAGYFITQDIYEEWALNIIIDRSFQEAGKPSIFFESIGSALPIRRAFRLWLSEKLLTSKETVQAFIAKTISDQSIPSYWKDELYVSILRSDHASIYFKSIEDKLLENDLELLKRIIFLLRIACKGVDDTVLTIFGLHHIPRHMLSVFFTKPQGSGWGCIIEFIYRKRKTIGVQYSNIILPLLNDWISKNKTGDTTRAASLMGLYYYEELISQGTYGYRSGRKDENILVNVILQGAAAISEELKVIFDKILSGENTSPHEQYYDIVAAILASMVNCAEVVKSLPTYVIKLADLFWFHGCDDLYDYHHSSREIERDFGLSDRYDFNYFPPSAYQTPILFLLNEATDKTINFILSFVNKAVACATESDLKDEFEKIELFITESELAKQFISHRLWNTYRGTQVSTDLLESMHMALERWFLQYAKTASKEDLEKKCLHLLKNSRSASITAVIVSVVQSQPAKLFSIALILFKTKALFFHDTSRLLLDQTQKAQLLALRSSFPSNVENKILEDERIKACDDSHRSFSLEHLLFYYQLIKFEGDSDVDVSKRQQDIWDILDRYYKALPDTDKETEDDRTWRLYLARMDRRKMSPEVQKKDGQTFVSFNPEIDPDLRKFSEESMQKNTEMTKYTSLRLWARYRFDRKSKDYQGYPQYEQNLQLAISETREIAGRLLTTEDERDILFNGSIPAYVAAVLIRDFADQLRVDDREFCRDIIMQFAVIPLNVKSYSYQVGDGTQPAILSLPLLIKYFPERANEIKSALFFLLCNAYPYITAFVASTIQSYLWSISPADANSVFLGYLLLKPKYELLRDELRRENFKREIYQHSEVDLKDRFIKRHAQELDKIEKNNIRYDELHNIESIDLYTLKTAFDLLPKPPTSDDHKKFIAMIMPIFAKKFMADRHLEKERVDYSLRHQFWEKLAYFILNLPIDEIKSYLQPFIDNAQYSDETADLLGEFISIEDRLQKYEEFWTVWNAFYDKIVEICKTKGSRHYADSVIHNYILAYRWWKEDAKEWHSLKDRERTFYRRIIADIGQYPAVFYSVSKVLNDIGSNFVDEGITWIHSIVEKIKEQPDVKLETNTIYYVENFMRRYILLNRRAVRTSRHIKDMVIDILTFLIERGSITGYLLREDIL